MRTETRDGRIVVLPQSDTDYHYCDAMEEDDTDYGFWPLLRFTAALGGLLAAGALLWAFWLR